MTLKSPSKPKSLKDLASHVFDTSTYVIMKSKIRRDSVTGRLTNVHSASHQSKAAPKTKMR